MSQQNKGSAPCLDFINTLIQMRRGGTRRHCSDVRQMRSERPKSKTEVVSDADPATHIHTTQTGDMDSLCEASDVSPQNSLFKRPEENRQTAGPDKLHEEVQTTHKSISRQVPDQLQGDDLKANRGLSSELGAGLRAWFQHEATE